MVWFCLRSLFTKYGWLFIRHIAVHHPIRTVKALFHARIKNKDIVSVSVKNTKDLIKPDKSIVGVGFCMKPKDPACPSLDDLHGCKYFEEYYKDAIIPEPCKDCYIKKMGLAALKSRSAFYIMTSAKDILFDVFKPTIDTGKFETGAFVLCRYSFKPFFIGMHISGIKGFMFPFCAGDCRDYKTWIKADRGEKADRTELDIETQAKIKALFCESLNDTEQAIKLEKRDNIFYPICNRIANAQDITQATKDFIRPDDEVFCGDANIWD